MLGLADFAPTFLAFMGIYASSLYYVVSNLSIFSIFYFFKTSYLHLFFLKSSYIYIMF